MSSSTATAPPAVSEPFPIFTLAHKYLLYDVNVISHIRQKYNVSGVLIGGLPQAPQQNVFLGVPLELMPEEARLLVEKGVAYVVDDTRAHKRGFLGNGLGAEEKRAFQLALRRQGQSAAREVGKRTEDRKKAALKEKLGSENWNDIPEDMLATASRTRKKKGPRRQPGEVERETAKEESNAADADEVLFEASSTRPDSSRKSSTTSTVEPTPFAITPTTSTPPLQVSQSDPEATNTLPEVPPSYKLYKHMHEGGYFMAPGLRFGCQYMAYPGDPLRFHSHFLCNGMDWDQEFNLLDLVGGGRLGTGVKKGFLIGGEQPGAEDSESGGGVRAFCVEWGGM